MGAKATLFNGAKLILDSMGAKVTIFSRADSEAVFNRAEQYGALKNL
jgi:hypothetical protein